jgi:hypothetical protein
MDYIQFRVHPSVGMARFGPSTDWYFLGPEVPRFVQERYPNLRHQPIPLRHPASPTSSNPPQPDTGSYRDKYVDADTTHPEKSRRIMPQAARFRVFAYVYAVGDNDAWPYKVFELKPEDADIEWTVTVRNQKSVTADGKSVAPDSPVVPPLSTKASSPPIKCQNSTNPNFPNLAWLKLEKDANDKLTGRLHVIGNEGKASGGPLNPFPGPYLFQNNWFDPAADGPVVATVELKPAFKSRFSGAKYFIPGQKDAGDLPQNGKVAALPAWVVVNMPDYMPDMGHFVSLWDLGLDLASSLLTNGKAKAVDGQHHRVRNPNPYTFLDYWVHIHPLLGLFSDVTFASGQARAGGYGANAFLNGTIVQGQLDQPATAAAPAIKLKIVDALHLKAASLGQPFLMILSDQWEDPLGGTFEFVLGYAIADDGTVTVTRGVRGTTSQGVQQKPAQAWPAGTVYFAGTKTGFIETPLADSIPADGTTIKIDVQSAHEMPEPNARDLEFRMAIWSGNNLEWMLCTANAKTKGELTVERGQDGTAKRPWGVVSDNFPVVIAPALGHKTLDARTKAMDLATGGGKAIADMLVARLRLPSTVYDRHNFKKVPTESGPGGDFPRPFGRRMNFTAVSKPPDFAGAVNVDPGGSVSRFHELFTKKRKRGACRGNQLDPDPDPAHPGQQKALPPKLLGETYPQDAATHVQQLDDYYWIVSEADMPLLKELALTHIQLTQFQAWAGGYSDTSWFEQNLGATELAMFFNDTHSHTMDEYLDRLLNSNGLSRYAPFFLDVASMGKMLGGSFLPGIEVGREGGIPNNWTLYHGGTPRFPDLRFHPQGSLDGHSAGTLTKDLSVPWFADFIDCGETFWPTARPQVVFDKNGIAYPWLNQHLHADTEDKFKVYWLQVGFIRRQQGDKFAEDESLFHRP